MMATLCILGSMFKKVLFISLFLLVATYSYSQNIDNSSQQVDAEEVSVEENFDPDASGASMPNVGIANEKPIEDIAEGSGTVRYSGVAIRAKPASSARVLRTASQSEKVLILGEIDDWLYVRMYNNREGYIMKKYVRTGRVFRDESSSQHSMDKTASFEIHDIVNKFNESIKNSVYAKKYKTMPIIEIRDERIIQEVMSITFFYSCIDAAGHPIPSYKKNDLQNQMIKLLELIISRLLLSEVDVIKIIINTPNFDDKGNMLRNMNLYSEITINREELKLEEVKDNISTIWESVASNMNIKELFADYPSN